MVRNGVLDGSILTEIRRDGFIASVWVLLPGLLGVNGLSIPRRASPAVSRKRFLHAKTVIGVLRQFGFAVAGLQNELGQRHGCKDAELLLVCSKQRSHLCYNCRIGKGLELSCLQAGRHRSSRCAKRSRHLGGQITEASVQPVSGTRFGGKPSMNRQHHLICRRGVIESFILVRQPDEFRFPVALADVGAELNEAGVDRIVHSIGVKIVAGALNGNGSLVILPAGRTPATVLLLDTKRHSAVLADAVVTACLTARADEAPADAFRTQLTNNTVGRDAVDAVRSLPGVVRAEFRVCHKWAVRISHSLFLQMKKARIAPGRALLIWFSGHQGSRSFMPMRMVLDVRPFSARMSV